jgi:hypothetical protein
MSGFLQFLTRHARYCLLLSTVIICFMVLGYFWSRCPLSLIGIEQKCIKIKTFKYGFRSQWYSNKVKVNVNIYIYLYIYIYMYIRAVPTKCTQVFKLVYIRNDLLVSTAYVAIFREVKYEK